MIPEKVITEPYPRVIVLEVPVDSRSKKVLITGSSGLAGSHLTDTLVHSGAHIVSSASSSFSIADANSVKKYIDIYQPNTIVHYAAHTDLNAAEKERGNQNGLVWQMNVEGTRILAEISKSYNIDFIYISTDSVFSAKEDDRGPYAEDHPPEEDSSRVSWYGYTKAEAERIVKETLPNSSILRISNITRLSFPRKLDYVRKILYLYDQGKLYPMFKDQYLTLTLIDDISVLAAQLIKQPIPGIYHISSSNIFTPFELANYLLKQARNRVNVVHASSFADNPEFKNRYPQYGGLNTHFTQEKSGLRFLTWQEIIDSLVANGIK